MLPTNEKGFKYVDPKTLIINKEINAIYGIPPNYEEIRENIRTYNIVQPIIVNKSTLEVISGNLRLKIALELNYSVVPVIFCELDLVELMKIALSSNMHREKTLMDRYNEMNFIESFSNVTQGSRTDLNPQLMEESELKKKLLSIIPPYTLIKIKRAKKLLKDLNIVNIEEKIVQDIQKIDNGDLSLNAYVEKLESAYEEEQMKLNVPESYEIHRKGFTVYNKDSSTLSEIDDQSISTIICSPPYRKMRTYGDDPNELGKENTKEEYIKRLLVHYTSCHRVLKDNGSLFINISEGVLGAGYEGVVHQFIFELLNTGLFLLNDELIWSKHNPVYTTGNRFVRSHEYLFHLVKSNNKGFKYNSNIFPFILDKKRECVYGIDKEKPKILSLLELRQNTLFTNVANTGKLRMLCRKNGLPMEHTATFPISVPALLILLTTDEGDKVIDIFQGVSTTGEACIRLGRNYIGYEKYASYVKATEVRINNLAA